MVCNGAGPVRRYYYAIVINHKTVVQMDQITQVQLSPVKHSLDKNITMSVADFCTVTGLGQTLVRQMISDGRLQGLRIGPKKLLVVVQSYLNLIAKQTNEGVPTFDKTAKAVEARKAKRAVDLAELGLK